MPTGTINDAIGFNEKLMPASTDTNRYSGGSQATAGDHPYVKGYFYVFFGVPTKIFGEQKASKAEKFLLVSAESYTPPGDRQLNIQDVNGQGGVSASFVTGQTIARDFSIQYKDYWGAPIFRIHRMWTNYINPYLGVVDAGDTDIKFASNEYKGVCMVVQTKPIKKNKYNPDDIIKVDLFDGVQPTTDLKSVYDANIEDNSFVKPTVSYKFDGFPLDETNPKVVTKAIEVLKNKDLFSQTSKIYENLASTSNLS